MMCLTSGSHVFFMTLTAAATCTSTQHVTGNSGVVINSVTGGKRGSRVWMAEPQCDLVDWLIDCVRLIVPSTHYRSYHTHMGTGFYGSNDPTNSVKALREHTKQNKTPQCILTKEYREHKLHTKKKQKKLTKPRFGRLLRPPAWKRSGTILVERERMGKRRK